MNLKNRIPAKVSAVKKGKLNAHVDLMWESTPLSVIVTSGSADDMNIKKGEHIEVRFKASDVILAKNIGGFISARNIFKGTVRKITKGFPLAMVSININGTVIAAEITLNSLKDMNLATGDQVEAIIKSTELVLAKI